MADRLRVLRSVVKRKTVQTNCLGPQVIVKWERMSDDQNSQEVGLEAAIL